MCEILKIDIIKNYKESQIDIIFEIPGLIDKRKFDSYYFDLAIESKSGVKAIKNVVLSLINSWYVKLIKMKNGHVIYLPIDFSDQYTGCLRVEKKGELYLSYGFSEREGWNLNLLNPIDFYDTIKDFNAENNKSIKVKQSEFEQCLTRLTKKLKR